MLAAGSIHPSGLVYTIIDDSPIIPLPDVSSLVKHESERVNASPDGPPIPHGSHDRELFRIASMLRGAGMDREQILENLIQICEKRCVDHGADYIDMCERKTDQAIKYPVTPAPSIPLLGGRTAEQLQAAKDAEAKRKEEQEKQTRQAIKDEQVRREHSESEVAQSETTKLVDALTASRYDFAVPVAPRTWHYRGWIPLDVLALWLGARKAEKSLFALRKAMHDACDKDWMRHRNMLGPVRVLYFDAENDKSDVDERYREIVAEFSLAEQILIHKNLTLFIGKELKKAGVDIEVGNRKLYELMRACDPRVVYLDPWYQLQSIKAIDNEAQKKALEMFEEYFPNATIFLLHHTGRESQESLLKTNPAWLRIIGAERWSSKSAGGNVLTKKAELIICQERFVKLDAEGSETESCIDFQVYSRSSEGSPLFSFKTVRGEKVNGAVVEYKFRREMTVELSSLAGKIARKLRGKGPWASRYEITNDVGDGGKQYKAIEELVVKGFIIEEGTEFYLSEAGYDDAVDLSAENVVAVKTAGKLLKELLYRKNRTPNAGVPRDLVKARAEQEDINWNSIRQAKGRLKVQEEDRDEGGCRVSYWFIRPESAGIALVA